MLDHPAKSGENQSSGLVLKPQPVPHVYFKNETQQVHESSALQTACVRMELALRRIVWRGAGLTATEGGGQSYAGARWEVFWGTNRAGRRGRIKAQPDSLGRGGPRVTVAPSCILSERKPRTCHPHICAVDHQTGRHPPQSQPVFTARRELIQKNNLFDPNPFAAV